MNRGIFKLFNLLFIIVFFISCTNKYQSTQKQIIDNKSKIKSHQFQIKKPQIKKFQVKKPQNHKKKIKKRLIKILKNNLK
jgi:hypothetical protein